MQDLYAGKLTMTGGPHGEKVMYATGAEFVEVRVHALTREIRVPAWYAAKDSPLGTVMGVKELDGARPQAPSPSVAPTAGTRAIRDTGPDARR